MRKDYIARGVVWIFIGIGLIITLFPFAWVVSLSLRIEKEVFTAILFFQHLPIAPFRRVIPFIIYIKKNHSILGFMPSPQLIIKSLRSCDSYVHITKISCSVGSNGEK